MLGMGRPEIDDATRAGARDELVWALRWLAAEPQAALSAVPEVPICTADEIALDLNHWFEFARAEHLVDLPVLALLEEIDREFLLMSGQPAADLWTDEALAASPEWQKQRGRARRALTLMGEERADEELKLPRPGNVYVRGAPDDSYS
jgi:hypothetical protein